MTDLTVEQLGKLEKVNNKFKTPLPDSEEMKNIKLAPKKDRV
jgi:hypothetical protein